MPNKPDLAGLIERVEKLTGPDREVDAEITCATYPPMEELMPQWSPDQREAIIPHYTSSLDAAVALVERCLKTHSLHICIDPSGNGAKINWWPNGLGDEVELGPVEGVSVTPENAVLLALLRAMQEERT